MKVYLHSTKALILENDTGTQRVLPPGSKSVGVDTVNEMIAIEGYLNPVHYTYIQKEDGSAYSSLTELVNAISDFFVKASGAGGDLTPSQSEVLEHLSLNDDKTSILSDINFFAPTLDANPGSLNLGNIKIESANHGISYRNYINDYRALVSIQGYTPELGSLKPLHYKISPQRERIVVSGTSELMPSLPYGFIIPYTLDTPSIVASAKIIPAEAGTLKFTLRIDDENGKLISTVTRVIEASEVDTEVELDFNDFILNPGNLFHMNIEGIRLKGTTRIVPITGEVVFNPHYHVKEYLLEYKGMATEDYVISKTANPDFVASHSSDTTITFGAFATTKVIRRRDLSTGVDTFYTSTDTFTNEADWLDWQNREDLVYGS